MQHHYCLMSLLISTSNFHSGEASLLGESNVFPPTSKERGSGNDGERKRIREWFWRRAITLKLWEERGGEVNEPCGRKEGESNKDSMLKGNRRKSRKRQNGKLTKVRQQIQLQTHVISWEAFSISEIIAANLICTWERGCSTAAVEKDLLRLNGNSCQ